VSLQRFFANGTFSACSQPCGGGIRTRVVNCTDATNALFAPAACMGPNVQMPPTSEVCNTQSCAAFAYQPEYPSTLVNLNIPTSLESDIGGKNIPRSAVNSTIVIPVRANNGTYGDARNKDGLAVHFTGSYPDFLFGLNLAIVHEGVVVPLLRIPYNCFTSSIQKFAQITVADNSGLPNVYCQEQAGTTTLAEYPVFQSDQAYVIPSVTPLSAFNGLPVAGTYTLYAWTEFNALTANTDTTDRTFVQWGITTNPTNCPPNQFTPTDRLLNSGVCQPCSQNSYPVAGGVNSPNSCPCYPGYDASVPGQCTACPFGTYRSLTATVSPVFQQRQGVAGCVDCHASTSASPATSPNDCMTDCARGYVPITTTANGISTTRCTECPAGTQKTSNQPTGSLIGAGTCTACPANTYTSKPGSLLCLPCAANATSVAGSPACSCKVGFTDYTGTSTDGSACQPTRRFVAGDFSTCLSLNPWQPTLASPCENGRRVRTVTCQDMFGQVYPESMCPLGTKQSTETPCNTDVSCLPNGYLPQFASGYLGQPIPYNNMTAAANAPFKSVLNVPANMAGVDPLISNNNRVIVHFTAFYPSLIHTLQVSLCKTIGSTERCVQLLNLGSTVCLGSYGSEGAAASTIFSDQASIPALFCTNANLVTFKGGESYVVPPAQALATFNGLPTDGTWTLRVAGIPNQYFVAPDVLAARKLISWGLTFKPKSCSPGTFTPQPYFNTGACMNCPNPATTNKINTFPAAQINTVNSCPCKGGYYIDTSSVMSGQAPTCKVCPAGQYRMISPFMPPYFQQTQTSTGCQPCHSGTPRFPQPTEYAVQCDNQCEPGYYFNPAFGCLPCSYGAYKGTVGPQACQSCALTFAPRSTTLNKNATSINECICGPGYQGVRDTTTGATRCTPCLAGSYKETAGNGLCSLCSIAGTNAPGSVKCQCLFGFDIPKDFVGQPPANGSACSPIRFFSPSSWSACNATCETGTQTRSLVCTDISGAIFSDDACAGKTMPSTIRTCVAQSSCTKNGYVPQFSTGPVDYQFTGSVDVPLTIEGSGVTIGTNNNGADLSLGQVSFAVLVSLFTDAATTVTVRLTRVSSGVSQTFAVPTVSARFGYHNPSQPLLGDSATQLVYADASNWDGPRGHTVLPGINEQFAAGETYILRAVVGTTSLAARFDGVPLDGDWLLTVTAAAGTLRSWGITANPTVCPLSLQKSFVPAPSLTSACLPCPAKSTFIPTVTASAGQTNSINSCPCNAGYDAMTPYTCTACPTGTARPAGRTAADDGTTNAINAQQLGASFCTACNSANPAGSANCLSDITNPAGSFCAQGYEGPAASGLPCVPCTTYKYKNATDASACVNCPQTGFDQSANPLANGQGVRTYGAQPATQFIQCDCDGGFYNDSSVSTRGGCKQCPVGTYRPAVPTRQITGCLPCAALISAAVEFPAYRCNCTRIGNIQYIDPMSTIDGSGCQPTVKLVYVPAGTTASFTTSSEDITDALFAGIPCNAPCDGGKKNIVPKCVDQDSNEQDLALCFNQGYTLSGPLSRDCNTVSCLYSVALGRQFAQPFTGYTPQYSKVYLPSTFYGGNGNPFVAPQKTNNGAGSMFDANTAPTAPFSNGRGYPIADPNNEFSLTDRACTQIGQSDQCGLPIKLVAQAGTTSAGGYATVSSPTTSVLTVPPQPKGQDIIGPQNPISVLTTLIYGSVDTAPLGSVGTLRMELEHYNTRVTLFALPQAAGCQGSVGSVMTNDQSPSPHVVYPAQLVFSDNAALNFPTCSPDDQPFFMGGEAYILRAASPLSAFYGLPVQGDYTLRLSSIPFAADQRLTGTPARELQATERYLASWGLVFNATTCGPNSFSAIIDNGAGSAYNPTSSLVGGTFAIEDTAGQLLAVPSANTAQCMECGTDSQLVNRTSVTAQMSSVMSCACRPGFDYATLQVSSGPACSPCAAGSYKNSSSPYGIQAMQNSCTKCPPTAGTDTVTGATLFSQACTGTCPANQFFSQNTHGGECLPCPIGTTRSIVQPVCVQCSGGMTTQAPGSGTCGCPSGHYEEGGICKPCVGGYTSATAFGLVGDTMCTPCPLGYNSTYPYVSCMLCSTDALGRQLQPIWDGSNVDPHPGFFCGLGAYWTAPAFPAAGTPCPSTCDGGIFTRTVTCMNNGVPDPTGAACANLPKPATTQFCPVGQSSVSCIGNGYLTDYQTGLLTAGTARIPFADEAAASPTRLNLDLQIPNTGAIISAANQLAVAVTVQFPSQLSSLKLSLTRLDGNGNPTIVVPLFEVPVCSGQIIDSTDPSVSIQGAQIVFADQASQPGLCSTGNQGANLYARNAYFMNPTFPLSAFYGQPLGGTWRLSAWSTDQVGATPAALRNIVSWGISLAATKCLPNQYVALPALNKGCTLCPANSMSAPAGVNGINNCACMPGYDAVTAGSCTQCDVAQYRSASPISTLPSGAAYIPTVYQTPQEVSMCQSCNGLVNNTVTGSGDASNCGSQCFAGYTPLAGQACRACEQGKYQPVDRQAAPCLKCTDVLAHSTTASTGATASTACVCQAGYVLDGSGVCQPCAANTYTTAPGASSCTLCANTADTNVPTTTNGQTGATQCVCPAGYIDYSYGSVPTGAWCGLPYTLTYQSGTSSFADCDISCITPSAAPRCLNANGQDAATMVFGTSVCNGQSVPTGERCALTDYRQSCLARGDNTALHAPVTGSSTGNFYVPDFGSNGFAAAGELTLTVPVLASTITFPKLRNTVQGTKINATSQLAIVLNGQYTDSLETLTVNLTHAGTTVTLFRLNPKQVCAGSYVGSATIGSQIVFADNATLPAVTCSGDNMVTMQAGEAYIVQPVQSLRAFWGHDLEGDWTLTVSTVPSSLTGTALGVRRFFSWGLSRRPTVCSNGYTQTNANGQPGLLSGPCVAYPANVVMAAQPGVRGVNSAPCQAGYDSRLANLNTATGYRCDPVAVDTFRPVYQDRAPQYQLQLGVPQSVPCHSRNVALAGTTPGWDSAADCSTFCAAGYELAFPSDVGTSPINEYNGANPSPTASVASDMAQLACRPCGHGKFKVNEGPQACVFCGSGVINSTGFGGAPDSGYTNAGGLQAGSMPNTGSNLQSTCFCPPGFGADNYRLNPGPGVCAPCPSGTVQQQYTTTGTCQVCQGGTTTYHGMPLSSVGGSATPGTVMSVASADGSKCVCPPGFFDAAGGQGYLTNQFPVCVPIPQYLFNDTYGDCSVQCGGGVQTRTPRCLNTRDTLIGTNGVDGVTCANYYADQGLTVPVTQQACKTQACSAFGYLPTYDYGQVNETINSFANRNDYTLTMPASENQILSASYSLAVHFTAKFPVGVQALRVVLAHSGVEVPLFELDPTRDCPTGFSSQGSQLVFTDGATIPTLVCSPANQLQFLAGQAYIVKPASPLADMFGLNSGGAYTLRVYTLPDPLRPSATANPNNVVVSWGISFRPTICPVNQFIMPPSVNGTCVPCPDNAMPANSGINGIHSCPCAAGYDASTAYKCTQCPLTAFRALSTVVPPYFNQALNQSGCVSCNATVINTPATSTASCSSNCLPGFFFTGSSCQPCGLGFFKSSPGPQQCDRCTNGYANQLGQTSCKPCATNAQSSADGSRCDCKVNFGDYSTTKAADGSTCSIARMPLYLAPSECSAQCEGGFIERTVLCIDMNLNVYDLASCPPLPVPQYVPCNNQLCTQYGYVPQWASGSVNLAIPLPQNQLRAGFDPNSLAQTTVSATAITSVLSVPATGSNAPLGAGSQVAVHFTSIYLGYLDTLHVTLSHAGATVTLFELSQPCPGGSIDTAGADAPGYLQGAQLIFADQASMNLTEATFCNAANPITFQAGHAYVLPPVESLSEFWGLPAQGKWTLTVYATALPNVPLPQMAVDNRKFISWGLTFNPTVCAANQFVSTMSLLGKCESCPRNTYGWPKPGVNPPCYCPMGAELRNGVCSPCVAGTYKDNLGYNACKPCVGNSFSTGGTSTCQCKPGFADYGLVRNGDGSGCQPMRQFRVVAGACSALCEGGVQTRNITCTDLTGANYPLSTCTGDMPVATQVCNTGPCAAYGFVPDYTSGWIGAPITTTTQRFLLTVNASNTNILGPRYQIAVPVTLSYQFYLQTLRITLQHGGQTVTLFNLGSSLCFGSFEPYGSQIVFSDQSSLPPMRCDNDHLLQFRAGQSYIQLPAESLGAFDGMRAAGDWELAVYSVANAYTEPASAVASRQLLSWGLTFQPTVCPTNSYVPGSNPLAGTLGSLKGQCARCPSNSFQALPGANTINNCPCRAGFDADQPYQCTPVPQGAYRSISTLSAPTYQQRQGVSFAQKCFSTTAAAASTSATQCSDQCQPGFYAVAGSACQPCPQNTYKTTTGPAACTACPAGTFTVAPSTPEAPNAVVDVCVCAPGYTGTGRSCSKCSSTSYKSSIGAGSCIQCAAGSVANAAGTGCVCAPGYMQTPDVTIAPAVNGSTCIPTIAWQDAVLDLNSCPTSGLCENATYAILRQPFCGDVTGRVYPTTMCTGQPANAIRPCPLFARSCMPDSTGNTFIPQFSASGRGMSGALRTTQSTFTTTLSIPAYLTTPVSQTNAPAIHLTASFPQQLQRFRVTLSHAGVSVLLFAMDPAVRCDGQLGYVTPTANQVSGGSVRFDSPTSPVLAQLVFTDQASIPFPVCDASNIVNFIGGSATVVQPYDALNPFYGLPMGGDWSLTVSVLPGTPDLAAAPTLRNWGITFNPVQCDDGEYQRGPDLLTKQCVKCRQYNASTWDNNNVHPLEDGQSVITSNAGVNAATSCGCMPGFDNGQVAAGRSLPNTAVCLPCPAFTWKSTTLLGACMPCASHAVLYKASQTLTGQTNCTCAKMSTTNQQEYIDYSAERPASGSQCTYPRMWYRSDWSSCATPACENRYQYRRVYCSDGVAPNSATLSLSTAQSAGINVYPDADCAFQGAKPTTVQPCATTSAVNSYTKDGFTPSMPDQFNRNVSIPIQLGGSFDQQFAMTISADQIVAHNLVMPTAYALDTSATPRLLSQYGASSNTLIPVTAHVALNTPTINDLTLRLHYVSLDSTITADTVLLQFTNGACGSMYVGAATAAPSTGMQGAQTVFSDAAQVDTTLLNNQGGCRQFQAGQSYLLQASGGMAVFGNALPQGTWTLEVSGNTGNNVVPVLVSWGLSFGTVQSCTTTTVGGATPNLARVSTASYLQPGGLLVGTGTTCQQCPSLAAVNGGSLGYLPTGAATISKPQFATNCPCPAGTDLSGSPDLKFSFSCTDCGNGRWRTQNVDPTVQPNNPMFQLVPGQSQCQSCHSTSTYGVYTQPDQWVTVSPSAITNGPFDASPIPTTRAVLASQCAADCAAGFSPYNTDTASGHYQAFSSNGGNAQNVAQAYLPICLPCQQGWTNSDGSLVTQAQAQSQPGTYRSTPTSISVVSASGTQSALDRIAATTALACSVCPLNSVAPSPSSLFGVFSVTTSGTSTIYSTTSSSTTLQCQCVAGTQPTQTGSTTTANTQFTAGGLGSCVQCPAGYFKPTAGNSACVQCGANAMPTSDSTGCQCVSNLFYNPLYYDANNPSTNVNAVFRDRSACSVGPGNPLLSALRFSTNTNGAAPFVRMPFSSTQFGAPDIATFDAGMNFYNFTVAQNVQDVYFNVSFLFAGNFTSNTVNARTTLTYIADVIRAGDGSTVTPGTPTTLDLTTGGHITLALPNDPAGAPSVTRVTLMTQAADQSGNSATYYVYIIRASYALNQLQAIGAAFIPGQADAAAVARQTPATTDGSTATDRQFYLTPTVTPYGAPTESILTTSITDPANTLPGFNPAITTYSLAVDNQIQEIALRLTPPHSANGVYATIAVNVSTGFGAVDGSTNMIDMYGAGYQTLTNGAPAGPFLVAMGNLRVGNNLLTVRVNAPDQTTLPMPPNVYTINVVRVPLNTTLLVTMDFGAPFSAVTTEGISTYFAAFNQAMAAALSVPVSRIVARDVRQTGGGFQTQFAILSIGTVGQLNVSSPYAILANLTAQLTRTGLYDPAGANQRVPLDDADVTGPSFLATRTGSLSTAVASNSDLANVVLTPDAGTIITPYTFSPSTLQYYINVTALATSMTFRPIVADPLAVVYYRLNRYKETNPFNIPAWIGLPAGNTATLAGLPMSATYFNRFNIDFRVVAGDKNSNKTYTFFVNRNSNVANLANNNVNTGAAGLSLTGLLADGQVDPNANLRVPNFTPNTYAYTSTVFTSSTGRVQILATLADPNAKIRIGVPGQISGFLTPAPTQFQWNAVNPATYLYTVELPLGDNNEIDVIVTSQDGTTTNNLQGVRDAPRRHRRSDAAAGVQRQGCHQRRLQHHHRHHGLQRDGADRCDAGRYPGGVQRPDGRYVVPGEWCGLHRQQLPVRSGHRRAAHHGQHDGADPRRAGRLDDGHAGRLLADVPQADGGCDAHVAHGARGCAGHDAQRAAAHAVRVALQPGGHVVLVRAAGLAAVVSGAVHRHAGRQGRDAHGW